MLKVIILSMFFKKNYSILILVLPAFTFLVLGLAYPLYNVFSLSFYEWEVGMSLQEKIFIGWDFYLKMLKDDSVKNSLKVTLKFAFWVVTIEMLLGTILAILLEKSVKGLSIYRTLLVIPFMVSPIAVGLIWRYILDARSGMLNHYLVQLGFSPQAWLADPELAFFSIVFVDIWQWTPFVFLMILAGLQSVNNEIEQAAKIDGANTWKRIIFIKLPSIKVVLLMTFLIRLMEVFRTLEVVFVMTFGGPAESTELLTLHIYKTAFSGLQMGYASAIAVLLMLLIFFISWILLKVSLPLNKKS